MFGFANIATETFRGIFASATGGAAGTTLLTAGENF